MSDIVNKTLLGGGIVLIAALLDMKEKSGRRSMFLGLILTLLAGYSLGELIVWAWGKL